MLWVIASQSFQTASQLSKDLKHTVGVEVSGVWGGILLKTPDNASPPVKYMSEVLI